MSYFEIRLLGGRGDMLLFQTMRLDLEAAIAHAKLLLDEHHDFRKAEIWNGMKCLTEIMRWQETHDL